MKREKSFFFFFWRHFQCSTESFIFVPFSTVSFSNKSKFWATEKYISLSALQLTPWLCNQWQSLKWEREREKTTLQWMMNAIQKYMSLYSLELQNKASKIPEQMQTFKRQTILCYQNSLFFEHLWQLHAYHHCCFIKWHDIKLIRSAQLNMTGKHCPVIKCTKICFIKRPIQIMNFVCYAIICLYVIRWAL